MRIWAYVPYKPGRPFFKEGSKKIWRSPLYRPLPSPVRYLHPVQTARHRPLQSCRRCKMSRRCPSGAFELVIPIAASYDELQRAMSAAFTDGKLYFSKDQPDLYLEKPELYASGGAVVVKVHIDGTVKKGFTPPHLRRHLPLRASADSGQ